MQRHRKPGRFISPRKAFDLGHKPSSKPVDKAAMYIRMLGYGLVIAAFILIIIAAITH